MARITEVLEQKGRTVHTIGSTATVFEAIEKMVALNVGSLVVVDPKSKPCGIITERDYLRQIALKGRSSRTTAVQEIMTPDVICVGPTATVEQCLAVMTNKRCRHLPVTERGALVGLVSVGDLVRHLVRHQQVQIEQLTEYICGRYPA